MTASCGRVAESVRKQSRAEVPSAMVAPLLSWRCSSAGRAGARAKAVVPRRGRSRLDLGGSRSEVCGRRLGHGAESAYADSGSATISATRFAIAKQPPGTGGLGAYALVVQVSSDASAQAGTGSLAGATAPAACWPPPPLPRENQDRWWSSGPTPTALSATEPEPKCGAGTCGADNCCLEREQQTHLGRSLPDGPNLTRGDNQRLPAVRSSVAQKAPGRPEIHTTAQPRADLQRRPDGRRRSG